MIRKYLFGAAAALLCAQTLVGGGFDPVSPAVWAMKEDPAKGWLGAVVLEDRMVFHNTHMEYLYRVRILSESGRAAAELATFSDDVYDIEGRTVYPDGKSVVFNKRKDLTSKSMSVGDWDTKRTVLVPPGVTADCVVEIRWKESAVKGFSPLPKRFGSSGNFNLGNAFTTLETSVTLPQVFKFSFRIFPAKGMDPEVKESGSFRTFNFRNIPARKPIPYGLESTRAFPRFVAYYIPEVMLSSARQGAEAFWKHAARSFYRSYFEDDVKKGKSYRALSQELRAGLTGTPIQQAGQLMARLEGRIRNLSYATYEEMGAISKKESEEELDSQDLDTAAKKSRTDSNGMTILYLNLLKDAGINPKVAFVADRDSHLFVANFTNPYQFTNELVGVEEPGKGTYWVNPSIRFAQPGMIHVDYQGTPALMVDTKDWAPSFAGVPAQDASVNVKRYLVDLHPSEEGDKFKISAAFSGYPEYQERLRYMALEPKEQEKALREYLQPILKSATLTKVQVKGAQSAGSLVTWEAEGTSEVEEGRHRNVDPFPGVYNALYVPDSWPDERVDPIVMPYLRIQQAISTIHIPEGWTWDGSESFSRSNRFGKVNWVVEKVDENTVKVVLKVEVTSLFHPASAYADLRTFLGWMSEASGRYLILRRK